MTFRPHLRWQKNNAPDPGKRYDQKQIFKRKKGKARLVEQLQCNVPYRGHQTNFHIWQLRVNTSTQQPVQRCSTYSRANFASGRDYQSNSQTLIGG